MLIGMFYVFSHVSIASTTVLIGGVEIRIIIIQYNSGM